MIAQDFPLELARFFSRENPVILGKNPVPSWENPVKNTCHSFFPLQTAWKLHSSLFLRTFLCRNTHAPPPPFPLPSPAPAPIPALPAIQLGCSLLHVHDVAYVRATVSNLNADPHCYFILWVPLLLSHNVFLVLWHRCSATAAWVWRSAGQVHLSGCSGLKEVAWMLLRSYATVWMQTLQSREDGWVNAELIWLQECTWLGKCSSRVLRLSVALGDAWISRFLALLLIRPIHHRK